MGASGTLLGKLDLDLIARIEANGRPQPPAKKKGPRHTPRNRESYRAFRRNEARRTGAVMLRIGEEPIETIAPSAELNRSTNWVRARTYAYAREIGPSTELVR